jgi:hypothetical protein
MYELTKKKSLPAKIVSAILILFLITTALKFFLRQPENDISVELLKAASEINKHAPIYIDSTVRLDNVQVVQGKILQYNYSITTLEKKDIDTAKVLLAAKEEMLDILRKNPKTSYFKENNVDVIVNYSDKNGAYVCKLIISGKDYP